MWKQVIPQFVWELCLQVTKLLLIYNVSIFLPVPTTPGGIHQGKPQLLFNCLDSSLSWVYMQMSLETH